MFLIGCEKDTSKIEFTKNFEFYSNKGFALVYSDKLIRDKTLNKKIDDKSLIVLNNKLLLDTPVKITNLLNGKNLIAKVGKKANYPSFYNSVISNRIVKDLEIDLSEPYVQIQTINSNTTFVANKIKTFKQEKKVANKVPVDAISIKNISLSNAKDDKNKKLKKNKKITKTGDFKYIIKFAELFFEDSAILLKNRLLDEFKVTNVKITELSKNNYRVYLGPFNNLESLKKKFNDISNLDFENIEILKL